MINLPDWLRLKIAIQTMKDHFKISLVLTLLVVAMAAMYAGMFPSMKDSLPELINTFEGSGMDMFFDVTIMDSYVGFLNVEFYELFWVLIFGIMVGFIASSQISKEVESKTIDILMSNPVSRKQIIFEKFLGLTPMVIMINLGAILSIWGTTVAINEEMNFGYLVMTHMVSVVYFMAIVSIGLLASVIFNEKMKAAIVMIVIVFASYFTEMIGKMVGNEVMRLFSLKHYFESYDILKFGKIDGIGVLILFVITIQILIITMIYFEHRDINVS